MGSGEVVEDSSQGSRLAARNWSSSQSAAGNTARPQTCQKGRLSRESMLYLEISIPSAAAPFLREELHSKHLKHSTWKTQCLAFMTRSVQVISVWHLPHVRCGPPYSLNSGCKILDCGVEN